MVLTKIGVNSYKIEKLLENEKKVGTKILFLSSENTFVNVVRVIDEHVEDGTYVHIHLYGFVDCVLWILIVNIDGSDFDAFQ